MMIKEPGDLWSALLASNLLAGEQQQEHIQYNAHTQVLVQLLQAAALVVAVAATLAGLMLMGKPLLWILQVLTLDVDRFLVAAVMVLVGTVGYSVARIVLERLGLANLWLEIARFFLATALVFWGLNLVAVMAGQWTWRESLRLLGGIGSSVAGALLCWRFVNELWNPLFPKSPIIHVLEHLVKSLAGEPQTVEVVQPYPIRMGGRLQGVGYVDLQEETEPPMPEVETRRMDPRFLDLVRFVELASERGLARDSSETSLGLVVKPHLQLPSGRRLTRPYYDELLTMAADPWNIVAPGGAGTATGWQMEPDAALRMLRAVVGEIEQAGRQATRQAGSQGV